MHLERCLRLLPHHNDGGGFFVAVFEKLAEHAAEAGVPPQMSPTLTLTLTLALNLTLALTLSPNPNP